jgi:hypothetical protein
MVSVEEDEEPPSLVSELVDMVDNEDPSPFPPVSLKVLELLPGALAEVEVEVNIELKVNVELVSRPSSIVLLLLLLLLLATIPLLEVALGSVAVDDVEGWETDVELSPPPPASPVDEVADEVVESIEINEVMLPKVKALIIFSPPQFSISLPGQTNEHDDGGKKSSTPTVEDNAEPAQH